MVFADEAGSGTQTTSTTQQDVPKFIPRTCCHCAVVLNVPVGEAVIICGACKKPSKIADMKPRRTYDGYLHTGCCCYKLTSCLPKRSFFYVAVLLTAFIIGAGFMVVAPEVLPSPQTVAGSVLWATSVFLAINVVCNFVYARTTDPGLPDDSGDNTSCIEAAASLPRPACSACNRPKPPRTHHCRTCNRCVLEMDHHCVFLDRCVGRDNLRFFLCFLLWVAVACGFVLYFCLALLSLRLSRSDLVPGRGEARRPGGLGLALARKLIPRAGRELAMPGQMVLGTLMHIMGLFISEVGVVPAALVLASGVTLILTTMLLAYHLFLAYHGKTQMESSFNLDPGVPTVKGWAAIRAAFSPPLPARPGVWVQRTAWWAGVLLPLPPSITGPKGHAS